MVSCDKLPVPWKGRVKNGFLCELPEGWNWDPLLEAIFDRLTSQVERIGGVNVLVLRITTDRREFNFYPWDTITKEDIAMMLLFV